MKRPSAPGASPVWVLSRMSQAAPGNRCGEQKVAYSPHRGFHLMSPSAGKSSYGNHVFLAALNKRPFGPTGVSVPIIGAGTWKLRRADHAEAALRIGLDLGLTHIDTAELYRGSEEIVGRAIAGRRGEVFLVSKVLPQNASYAGTREACDRSLRRLGTETLDVYLLHWSTGEHPIEETMRAMADLIDAGKIRHAGVSNFNVAELEQAEAALGRRRLACNQVYYSMEARSVENELLPYCKKRKIAIVGYSPFGSGNFPKPGTPGRKTIDEVAGRRGLTAHQVVLGFLARDPDVFLIPKAETETHVRENAAALSRPLAPEDVALLDAAFPRGSSTEIEFV
jgi:diketogulonate reductase-like aldo/keto reductase